MSTVTAAKLFNFLTFKKKFKKYVALSFIILLPRLAKKDKKKTFIIHSGYRIIKK